MRVRTPASLLPLAAAVLMLATACGSGSSDDGTVSGPSSGPSSAPSSAPSEGAAALASLVPASIKTAGKIVVGSDISYAPVEFKDDSGTVVGIDPDIGAALGKQLGITFEFQNATFDGLITSLTSKRIGIIMSAMSDNKKRQASVDFVDYFNAGTSILVAKGNPKGIKSLDDFCGKTIALQRGTTQDDVAEAQAKKCGSNKLTILKFDTDPEALLQIKQGRAVADMNDFPVAAYTAKTDETFEVVGDQIEAGPYGIAVPKDDMELRTAIQKAMQAIIDDGEYGKILDKWKVTAGGLTTATVNAGT